MCRWWRPFNILFCIKYMFVWHSMLPHENLIKTLLKIVEEFMCSAIDKYMYISINIAENKLECWRTTIVFMVFIGFLCYLISYMSYFFSINSFCWKTTYFKRVFFPRCCCLGRLARDTNLTVVHELMNKKIY